jgi:ankyrin repeat protein
MAGAIGLVFVASASAQASKDPGKPRRLIDLDAFATRVECDPEKLRLFMKKLDAALEEGADIDAADAYGNNPLLTATHWATWSAGDCGANDIVAFLLARGANPNVTVPPANDATPIDMAANALWPNARLVELLCAAGANPHGRMIAPEQTFTSQGKSVTTFGFPQIREAIEVCARRTQHDLE